MLPELLQKKNLFSLLYRIDSDLAQEAGNQRCPFCGGPLHFSNYFRKPRGGPDNLPEQYLLRFSLCCGRDGCRRRQLPSSCRFLGQKVYWHVAVIIIMALRQNTPNSFSINKLKQLFAVSRKTIKRWMTFYRDVFPKSRCWKRTRGLISSRVKNSRLPADLINFFLQHTGSAINAVISYLTCLLQGACSTKIKDYLVHAEVGDLC